MPNVTNVNPAVKTKRPFLNRRLKKLFLVLPFLGSMIWITACGVPKINFESNIVWAKNNIFRSNLVQSIQDALVYDNPNKTTTLWGGKDGTTSIHDYKDKDKYPDAIMSRPFCSIEPKDRVGNNANLAIVCSEKKQKTQHGQKYSYNFKKIVSLYITSFFKDPDSSIINPSEKTIAKDANDAENGLKYLNFESNFDWNFTTPKPPASGDKNDYYHFNFSSTLNELKKITEGQIFFGYLEVESVDAANKTHDVYIRFAALIDATDHSKNPDLLPSVKGSYDYFLAPPNQWIIPPAFLNK